MTTGNANSIGVWMAMQDGISPALRAIAQKVLGVHIHIANAAMFQPAVVAACAALAGCGGLKAVDQLIRAMGVAEIPEMKVMKLADAVTKMQVARQVTLGLAAGSQLNAQIMATIGNSLQPAWFGPAIFKSA